MKKMIDDVEEKMNQQLKEEIGKERRQNNSLTFGHFGAFGFQCKINSSVKTALGELRSMASDFKDKDE